MTNAYVDRATIKAILAITNTTDDVRLLALIEAISRQEDGYCSRHFFSVTQTRYFTGNGGPLVVLNADLIAVTTLKEDDDRDSTWGLTWATTDYELAPYDSIPTGVVDQETTRPYGSIEVNTRSDGDYSYFGKGQKRFELAGKWGYSESKEDSGDTVGDSPLAAAATTLNVTAGTNFNVGETLLIESEQLYVTAISSNALTVERGVNGTTDAQHENATKINIIKYPSPIREACIIETVREWQMQLANYASSVGVPETGEVRVLGGGLRDVSKQKLNPFRLLAAVV